MLDVISIYVKNVTIAPGLPYILDNFDNGFALKCVLKIYIFDLLHLLKMYTVIIIYITFYPSNISYIHTINLGKLSPYLGKYIVIII